MAKAHCCCPILIVWWIHTAPAKVRRLDIESRSHADTSLLHAYPMRIDTFQKSPTMSFPIREMRQLSVNELLDSCLQ